jgi:integrase/recombinase XerD
LKIEQKVTTYAARHSFATRLLRKGASPYFIKECLGHSTFSVTENYLAEFGDEMKEQFARVLTDF